MNQKPLVPSIDTSGVPRRKLRAVVFGGGIGMFPPLMQRFSEEFEIVAQPSHRIPALYRTLFMLLSIRWPRKAWYRKWMYYLEKTPLAFRIQTSHAARELQALEGQYDLILFFGAMFAPGVLNKPMFLFSDSCRWISANNPHDEISHFQSEGDRQEWLALEGAVYKSATRIFLGSEFVRQVMVDHYGVNPKHVFAVGFGAGIGFGVPYKKTYDGRSILYIGKGDFEKKGGTVLLKAFEIVRKQIPQAVLHVVGQDRLPSGNGVVSHGFVRDRNRILGLMQQANVLTLPSLIDRFGIVLVEAMAASTPCVSSDYGAMPEIVGDAGLVVPAGDADALSKALISILQDTRYSTSLGAAGRRRFEEKYNWDSIWHVVRNEIRTALSGQAPAVGVESTSRQSS